MATNPSQPAATAVRTRWTEQDASSMQHIPFQYSLRGLFGLLTHIAVVVVMVQLGFAIEGTVEYKICVPVIAASFGGVVGFLIRRDESMVCAGLGALFVLSLTWLLQPMVY